MATVDLVYALNTVADVCIIVCVLAASTCHLLEATVPIDKQPYFLADT